MRALYIPSLWLKRLGRECALAFTRLSYTKQKRQRQKQEYNCCWSFLRAKKTWKAFSIDLKNSILDEKDKNFGSVLRLLCNLLLTKFSGVKIII